MTTAAAGTEREVSNLASDAYSQRALQNRQKTYEQVETMGAGLASVQLLDSSAAQQIVQSLELTMTPPRRATVAMACAPLDQLHKCG